MRGKSKINEVAAQWLAEKGLKPCEPCSNENWKVYHNHGQPCPKATPDTIIFDEQSPQRSPE